MQQAQLQRLIDLWGKGAGKFPEPPIAPRHTVPRRTPTGGLNPAAAGGATDSRSPQGAWGGIPTRPRRVDTVEDDDLSLMSGYEGDEEWREYHGTVMWKREAEKNKRNPFDHQAYIRKGEKVESFEELMVITFKTMSQLLDLKYDLRGLIKHGQTLAEKAAKRVYKPTALVQYDESVRERAGEVGPTAFGPVSQEDILRHFCWDNAERPKSQAKQQAKPAKSKNDKICLRFNDGGCQAKSCNYSHRCIACEELGHSRKDCKALSKSKDKK